MLTQVVQIPVHIDMQPRLFGSRRLQCRVDYEGVCPRLIDGSQLNLSLVCTRFAEDILFLRQLSNERIELSITDQGGSAADRPAGCQPMHQPPDIGWRDARGC